VVAEKEFSMSRVLLVVAILVALVLALFGVQNPQPVNIRFINVQTGAVPLYVVILLSTLAGIILSVLAGLRGRIAQGLHVRRLEKRVAELEQEVKARSSARILDVPDAPTTTPAPSIGGGTQQR
jgi:uncharacterized integral membrane protein